MGNNRIVYPSEGCKVDIGRCSSFLSSAWLLLLVQRLDAQDHVDGDTDENDDRFTFWTANIILSRRRAARFVSPLLPSCVGAGTT